MATALQQQHACNRNPSTDTAVVSVPFRHDANNVSALQIARLQRKLAEEAAARQKEQLEAANKSLADESEDKEKVKKARDELSGQVTSLNSTLKTRDDELGRVNKCLTDETENKKKAEKARDELSGKVTTLTSDVKKRDDDLVRVNKSLTDEIENKKKAEKARDELSGQKANLEVQISSMQTKLPTTRSDNSLPFQFHEASVMIVNLRYQLAIDAGKDYCRLAHAYEYDLDNPNQPFVLRKVNNSANPDECWTISRVNGGQKLYFQDGSSSRELSASSDDHGRSAWWLIGRGCRAGSWVIKNYEWAGYISLANGSRNKGTLLTPSPSSGTWESNWVIIPLTFNS